MTFKVGDKVAHWTGDIGRIYQISENCMYVMFPDQTQCWATLGGNVILPRNPNAPEKVIRHLNKLERALE